MWKYAFVAATLLLSSCATEPVTPPTELQSITAESRLDREWTRKLEKSEKGRFEPLILDGVVYAASSVGEVIAIDEATGNRQWYRKLDTRLSSGVGGLEDSIYVSTENGKLLSLNTGDGSTEWEWQASSEVLAPVSAGFNMLIVRSADGRLAALDPANGEERWSVTYTPPSLTLNGYSRPLLLDGGVLMGLDDGRLLALSSANGRLLWQTEVSVPSGRSEVERLADIDGSIRVDDSAIYVANYQGRVVRIEPAAGQIVWAAPVSSTTGVAVSSAAVVVVGEDDELYAYDKENGSLLWTQPALKFRRLSSPQFLNDDSFVIGDLEGYLHTINFSDGRIIGRSRVAKSAIFPEIVPTDTAIFVQSQDGTIAALRLPQ